MGIACKQTMRHCFNFFNANLLVTRPPNLHKNINKQQKTTYTMAKSHKLFVCERHFTVDQIYVYSSRKSLKGGALTHCIFYVQVPMPLQQIIGQTEQ